ncbi:hypothetical protein A4X13_0g1667 [Tilletia indica]|uniref:Derlin n=1 Tax=Tilletia indica TaxID=43049 RepID=A0A177TV72_9BASI|nr:hypothetical protein A4X13_0g1667 [Tilletia indica]
MDIQGIPPITKIWAASALAISLAEHVRLVDTYQLFYTPRLVGPPSWQFWRPLTSFLWFGKFGIDLVFHLFFFMRYSRMLEETNYINRRADYLCLLGFSAAVLLVLGPAFSLPFLASPLAIVLVYIWSRRNRHVRLSLFGIIVVTAPYLPWSLVACSWLINYDSRLIMGDLLGIFVGHLFYFWDDVWPREHKSHGRSLMRAPAWLVRLLDDR